MRIRYWVAQVFTDLTSRSLKCVAGFHHLTKGLSFQLFFYQLQYEGTVIAKEKQDGANR